LIGKGVNKFKNPTLDEFIAYQKEAELKDIPYLWGGSSLNKVPLRGGRYYIQGIDCTGRVYLGGVRKNTSEMVYEGRAVLIEGKTADEIAAILKPGFIIVWGPSDIEGHLLSVIDQDEIVESCGEFGCRKHKKSVFLQELMKEKVPKNVWDKEGRYPRFVVRDLFHP